MSPQEARELGLPAYPSWLELTPHGQLAVLGLDPPCLQLFGENGSKLGSWLLPSAPWHYLSTPQFRFVDEALVYLTQRRQRIWVIRCSIASVGYCYFSAWISSLPVFVYMMRSSMLVIKS